MSSASRNDTRWDEEVDQIKRTFPTTAPLMEKNSEASWIKAFDRDPDMMGRLYRDIIKADQAPPTGRPGPRPPVDIAKAQPVVDAWLGRDHTERPYTNLSFAEALTTLAGKRSLRHVARLTDIPRMTIFRLVKGEMEPSREIILKVARAFSKEPSFFVEWRVGVVTSTVLSHLSQKPERSIRAYELLFWANTKSEVS